MNDDDLKDENPEDMDPYKNLDDNIDEAYFDDENPDYGDLNNIDEDDEEENY
jgi:hypothetical protein